MKRNALLIGGFVILALLIAVGAILWLSGNDIFAKQTRAVVYYSGSVNGLYVGAPVTFRGVTIGQVDSIAIDVDTDTLAASIPVRIRLGSSAVNFFGDGKPAENAPPDLPLLVQRGLRARLVAQSFVTGQKSVDLDFVPNTPSTLRGHGGEAEIPALADRFGALVDQVADLPLRDTVEDVRLTVKELRDTLVAARQAMETAQAVLGSANREVAQTGAASRATLNVATDALRQLQVEAAATLASVTRLADTTQGTVASARPEIERALAGSREAVDAARLAMNRVADMTAPGASLRGDLDASVRDLSQAARSLRDWSELLEDKPNAVIFGRGRP